ncbi:MAG: efflux RND transporter periplasmic adaptor subunit [Blastocatellia bacterium]|nr:efflux RND transporter periplasmic adaptor subunit [Blastocatellia bacterium]
MLGTLSTIKPRINLKILVFALLAALAFLTASCESKQEAATEKAPVLKDVKIERVAPSSIDEYYEAVGTVRSRTSSVLSSKIMGSVIALRVREGDRVRAGQTLIEIDNRDAATQLQKAEAGLREAQAALEEVERSTNAAESAKAAADAGKALAEATFKRYEALLERRSVSRQEFDEVEAKYKVAGAEGARAGRMLEMLAAKRSQALARIDQAKADIASARVYTGYARITSPIDGVVTARQTDIGQMAAPGAPLLTIEDDSRYRLEAAVEESQIANVRLGDTARVLIDALGREALDGRVAEIVPASDPASRSFAVKIDLPADGDKTGLRSGMFGKARFIKGQKQAITIPQSAVIERGHLTSVYVVDSKGIARLRLIKTGKVYDGRVEILAGLNEGERIVTSGAESVSEGSRVQ